MWEFSETIQGMNDSLSVLKSPVVSGNVSFYNEGEQKRIYLHQLLEWLEQEKFRSNQTLPFLKQT